MIKMRHVATFILLLATLCATAQERTVQNRPYTDLRQFHFGVVVGTHMQDIELLNAGPQLITAEDGTTTETLVTADQNRWDPGINVGVLGELRLNTHFQFRVAPMMYFGARHITFHNMKQLDGDGRPTETRQDLKTAYIATAFDVIFAAPRFNNHRPYLMAGLSPMVNLSGKTNDYLKLKRYGLFAEVGVGCDFYLPFFKLRPELKFVFGLGNSLDTNHSADLTDKSMLPYTMSVNEAKSKLIVLSFYFE